MVGELIADRFRVVRAIRSDEVDTEWICHDEWLNREVVLTAVVPTQGSADDATRAVSENRDAALTQQRDLAAVVEVVAPQDAEDGAAWLVTEYRSSRTLADTILSHGALLPGQVAWIGAQLADAVAKAHECGVIHGDLNPGRVFLDEGQIATVSAAANVPATQAYLGYLAPEQARGEDPGPESDVYALGATLFAAVEGHPPYLENQDTAALLEEIASEEPHPMARAGALAEPLVRMMDRDPRWRYTMAEAAEQLNRLATPHDVSAADIAVTPTAPVRPGDDDTEQVPGRSMEGLFEQEDPPVATAQRRDSRLVPWIATAAVLTLVFIGVRNWTLDEAPVPPDAQPVVAGSQPSPPPTPETFPTPSGTPSTAQRHPSPTPRPKRPTHAKATPATPGPEKAVEEYFSIMPQQTDLGWARLAPRMQAEVGRGSYEWWWRSIGSVQLHSAQIKGADTVQIDLTYYFRDGEVARETQLITLERSRQGYLIADNDVLSSHTVS